MEGVSEAVDSAVQPVQQLLPGQVVQQGRHVGVAVGHKHNLQIYAICSEMRIFLPCHVCLLFLPSKSKQGNVEAPHLK